jgi:5'-deoxynucleotidase YfbR-like HD superfamily hydrolase
MKIIDIIFDKNFTSLDETFRFNGLSLKRPESVSQHTYWVLLFAYLILDEMYGLSTEEGRKYLPLSWDIMGVCLFHDFDESLTGDVIFNFKHNAYNGDVIRAAIKDFVEKVLLVQYRYKENLGNKIYDLVSGFKKEQEIIKRFVKICDWLACYKYEWQEVNRGGTMKQWYYIMKTSMECLINEINAFIVCLGVPPDCFKFTILLDILLYCKEDISKLNMQYEG